jgi:phage head maturation protease
VNHSGVTMARTTNGSLMLSADSRACRRRRTSTRSGDVNDLLTAIEDRDVTEMSFAFRIDEGEWNDDFTEFRILRSTSTGVMCPR